MACRPLSDTKRTMTKNLRFKIERMTLCVRVTARRRSSRKKFPFADNCRIGPYFVDKALARNNCFVRNIGTDKTKVFPGRNCISSLRDGPYL